jgi:ubiquinone/menaquinone biosynthesis C-methylase UbiE
MDTATEVVHFDRLASKYDRYRTLDREPIEFLSSHLQGEGEAICDLGTGTGRYLIALVQHLLQEGGDIRRAVGVDPSRESLEIARKSAAQAKLPIAWLLATSDVTGLTSNSMSLITAFNSIHYFPIAETLGEIARIGCRGTRLAIYTRLREQECQHPWGRWFPGYLDYSLAPPREHVTGLSRHHPSFRLELTKDFTFTRSATFSWLCEQAQNKHYSTLARYPQDRFESAYAAFVEKVKDAYPDPSAIEYSSSYSLFLYEVTSRHT